MIYTAEIFTKWANNLYELCDKESKKYEDDLMKLNRYYNDNMVSCLVLHHILYIQEAILVLNTLFEKQREPKEISFSYYFRNIEKSELEKQFDILRIKYNKTKIPRMRNVLFAHKQIDIVGDPEVRYLNRINKDVIKKIDSIIKNLKELAERNFNCASANFIEDLYEKSFDIFYKTCKNYIEKLTI